MSKNWLELRNALIGDYEAQGFCTVCWEHWLWVKRLPGKLTCPKCGWLIAGETEGCTNSQPPCQAREALTRPENPVVKGP